jgi:hypothetical protein
MVDPVLQNNTDIVQAFALSSADVKNVKNSNITQVDAADFAKIKTNTVGVYGVQPSIYDALLDDFLKMNYQSDSALSLGEQLYTAKGSQSFASGSKLLEDVNVDPSNYNSSLLLMATN